MKHEHIIKLNESTIKHLVTLFSHEFQMSKEITQEVVPSFETRLLVQIALRNKNYQINLIHGVSEEAADQLLVEVLALSNDSDEKLELSKSAFGELSNVVACELAADARIIADFGKLLPTPPLVWTMQGGIPDFIKADGLSSRLFRGKLNVYTHFSVLKFNFPTGKVGESNNWSPTASLSIYDPHRMR